MHTSYQAYLRRFAGSFRGRAIGNYTLSNGHLVRRLGEREFARRWRELAGSIRRQQELLGNDRTMPIALENTLDELLAELLLPTDFLRRSETAGAVAEHA
jgi:hypothetical protein